MTTQNTVQSLPIITNHQEEEILTALSMLHNALGTYGKPLAPFADMVSDDNERQRITNRANRALAQLTAHRREAKIAAFRQGVADVVSPYVADAMVARGKFLELPKEVRAFIPAFPATVSVPVSEVAHIFPMGTSEEQMNKFLHQLGYKLSKKEKTYYIVAELDSK